MRLGARWLWCAVLCVTLGARGCGGDRFAPSTLRQYLREVVKETLDEHFAGLNARLDRIEASIEGLGESGVGLRSRTSVSSRHVVCNVASWATFRNGSGKFTVADIDTKACTHIVYHYASMDETSSELRALIPSLDLGNIGDPTNGNFAKFTRLKEVNPSLKTIISVGGYLEGSVKFSNMVKEPAKRATFIASAVAFLEKHGFDGLDMNWHHPTQRGGVPEDRGNFALLLEELREALRPRGWLVTATLSPHAFIVDAGYDVPRLSAALDLLFIHSFDYHGDWDRRTGHNAPLNQVTDSLNYYLQLGADQDKLVMGIPLYGRSFVLVDPARNGVGESSKETGFKGPYTQQDGSIGYNEMCEMRSASAGSAAEQWTQRWDDAAQVPYLVLGERWVSIEDARSVTLKAALARRLQLAGVALTTVDTDDFRGLCGQKNVLLEAIGKELNKLTASAGAGLADPSVSMPSSGLPSGANRRMCPFCPCADLWLKPLGASLYVIVSTLVSLLHGTTYF